MHNLSVSNKKLLQFKNCELSFNNYYQFEQNEFLYTCWQRKLDECWSIAAYQTNVAN